VTASIYAVALSLAFIGWGLTTPLWDLWNWIKRRQEVEAKYTNNLQLRTLAARDTVAQDGCCDVKLEKPDGERWKLCRLPAGHTDHRVTVEAYNPGDRKYVVMEIYRDKEQN
jgi:hypothetical protein